MGMFDEIVCDYPLPGTPPEFIKPGFRFQTKDLDCELKVYRIAEDGSLDYPNFTGSIEFYKSNICIYGPVLYTNHGEDAESVEYVAMFVDSKLTEIRETHHTTEPALHVSLHRSPLHDPPDKKKIRKWVARRDAQMKGRRIYVLFGSQTHGYWADVIDESDRQLCVKVAEVEGDNFQRVGDFEILHRASLDATHFDSKQDAERINREKAAARESERREAEELLAAKVAARG